jgi:hypothetical protein
MTNWNQIQQQQKAVCDKFKSGFESVDINAMVAFNELLLSNTLPINGLRHPKTDNLSGWYLWSGNEIPQDDNSFFKPHHVQHLIELRPVVLKYLGLPAGWRFQIDDNGYEDVWFEASLLNI